MLGPGDAQRLSRDSVAPAINFLCLAVLCLVVGARLLFAHAWGAKLPYLDECNQTGLVQLAAAQSGGIPWAQLFEPHMEHRLVTQRVFSLGLTALNGGKWDVAVELMASQFVWGAYLAFLVWAGARLVRGWRLWSWAALLIVFGALPYAWENLLWAFQVQFGFFVGFGLLSLWLLTQAPAFSFRWFVGLGCGVLAALSQAGGLTVLGVAAGLGALAGLRDRQTSGWRNGSGAALLLGFTVFFALLLPQVREHQGLHARDFRMFAESSAKLLAWPWSGTGWAALLLWAPGLCFLVSFLRRSTRSRAEWFVVALGLWSFALSLASAHSRGEMLSHGLPPSRYADTLAVGVLANALAFLCLLGTRLRVALFGLWLCGVLAGLGLYTYELSVTATRATTITALSLREFAQARPAQEEAYRAYERTRDHRVLQVEPPIYPETRDLALVIEELRKKGVWPEKDNPTWGSLLVRGTPWLAGASLGAGLLCLALASRATGKREKAAEPALVQVEENDASLR